MLRISLLAVIAISLLIFKSESITMKTTHKFLFHMLKYLDENTLPSHVNVFLCWDIDSAKCLVNDLSKSFVKLSVHTTLHGIMKQLHSINKEARYTFIMDMSCTDSKTFLQEVQTLNLLKKPNRWILLNPCNSYAENNNATKSNMVPVTDNINSVMAKKACQKLIHELTHFNLFIDSDVSVATKVSRNKFVLEEVYKLRDHKSIIHKEIGYWSEDQGMVVNKAWSQSIGRMNFHKSKIKAAMVVTNDDTLKHLTDTVNRHIDTISKVNYILFQHITDILNASIDIVIVKSWGNPENGTWSGMCGYLFRGDVDIGISSMLITKQLMEFTEFVTSTTPISTQFIFRRPPLSFVENIFTLPFDRTVWVFSTLLISMIGMFFYYALKWELHVQDNSSFIKLQKFTWSDIILSAVGAVSQQGTELEGRKISGRIILLMLFVVVIFLYTAHSACIVALLQSTTSSICTLNDLLYSGLTLAVHDTVSNRQYFSVANDTVRKAIYTKKVNPRGGPEQFYSLDVGMKHMRTDLFAFQVELDSAYKYISDKFEDNEKCNLQTINFLLEVKDPWLAVSKKSPYKEALTRAYRMVHERGLQSREIQRFYEKKPECSSLGTNFVSVGIKDCYAAPLLLLCGVLTAIGIMLLEIVIRKKLLNTKISDGGFMDDEL